MDVGYIWLIFLLILLILGVSIRAKAWDGFFSQLIKNQKKERTKKEQK